MRPQGRDRRRVRRGDRVAGDGADDRVVSMCAPRRPTPEPRARGLRFVEADDRPADVGRVQMATADAGEVAAPRGAHRGAGKLGHPGIEVVDFEHHHVGGHVSLASVEQPPGSRTLGEGRDDLDELIADAHQGVVQAELGNAGIVEADGELQMSTQSIDGRIEVTGGDDDLAEADHASMVERVVGGGRFQRMLTVIEGRVLGCLMEKERTVPDQYPLSMNALVSACNQSSSREPIMALDEFEVDASITSMKTQGLVRIVHPSHGRSVTRYRQVADEKFGLEPDAAAIMSVLLVRGPQTVAELRTRTERLHTFESASEVDACLHALATESALVQLLDRQPGQKEQRWQQLIAEESQPVTAPATMMPSAVAGSMADRVAQLEERVAKLESALADLL